MTPEERQYGTWKSPITVDTLCRDAVGLDSPRASGDCIYYLETRNDGRNTIIRCDPDCPRQYYDVLPEEYSVGSTVHEYGGGALAVHQPSGSLLFSNARDQGLYALHPNETDKTVWKAERIVQQPNQRFADFDSHPSSGLVVCVRETHDLENDVASTVRNEIVLVNLKSKVVETLISGTADFYSHPRFSPDGQKVCWLQWSHPEMPWTGSVLYCGEFDKPSNDVVKLTNVVRIAGEGKLNGIGQPRWGVDGTLFFVDDKSGYWQLYSSRNGLPEVEQVKIKGLENTDLAAAEPKLASCTYLPMDENRLVLVSIKEAMHNIVEVDLKTETYRDLAIPVIDAAYDAVHKISDTQFLVIGASAVEPQSLYRINISSNPTQISLLRESFRLQVPQSHLSVPKPMSCNRIHGGCPKSEIHGFFMPPCNPNFTAPKGTLSPLLVFAHGGPTGHYKASLQLDAQYWTSRGYAVYLLNYAGSTGYGRSYRRLLDGAWGILDAADAASAATCLSKRGLVDPSRLGIQGPSAGGYVALKTICDQPSVWAAAISLFGVSELGSMMSGTHKFESHYMDGLLYGDDTNPSPCRKESLRVERSPVYHAKNVLTPLMMLHGDKDTVVPLQQAEAMLDVLQKRGKPAELIIFEGEGHTQWRGGMQRRSIEAQERWWREYLLRVD